MGTFDHAVEHVGAHQLVACPRPGLPTATSRMYVTGTYDLVLAHYRPGDNLKETLPFTSATIQT